MSRRTIAGLLAFGLVVVLTICAALVDVPYVTMRPGPTLDVVSTKYDANLRPCSEKDCKPLVVISGTKVYPDTGALRMVTVRPSRPEDRVSLIAAMIAWVDKDDAILPREAVYPDKQTNKQSQQQSAVEMTSSQDNAIAAALSALKIKFRTDVTVNDVDPKGGSAGRLRKGDVIRAVDGRAVAGANELVAAIQAVTPGDEVRLTVRRGSSVTVIPVVTQPLPSDQKKSRIGVGIAQKYGFPFKVKFELGDKIGGPSAGMIFALTIYDLLTPGSLTGGRAIAGSGSIHADGTIGPIGGIAQKLVGAQRDGARLFLVAEENCAEAARSHYDRSKLRLVRVHTLAEAVDALDTWRKDPNAPLPRCTR